MRVTEKGQVTIPIEIRRRAGLLPHTDVEFILRGNEVILRQSNRNGGRGRKLVDAMRGRATGRLSTDEILALTRGE